MTGARGGVQEFWALVMGVHCVAQAGRLEARRVTACAEMMGAKRERRKGMRKERIVSWWTRYEGMNEVYKME